MESKYLTSQELRVYPQTGLDQALDSGFSKNIALAQDPNHFAVTQDGKSHLSVAVSQTQLNPAMHLLKEKHLLLPIHWRRPGILSWGART